MFKAFLRVKTVPFFSLSFFTFIFFAFFLFGVQSVSAASVSCPVTDGGVGDGDSTVNGTIQISANATWTMSGGAAGDYWDCTGKNILVTNNATLTLVGDLTTGAYPYIKTDNLQVDSGATISGDAKGCTAPTASYNGYGPNTTTNICTQSTAGYAAGSSTQNNTRSTGGGGYGGIGGNGAGGIAYNGTGGTTYGSSTAPVLYGSSGGTLKANASTYRVGGTGGGSIRLYVYQTLTLNGTITAEGGVGQAEYQAGSGVETGGGSGGSIYITTGTFTGTTCALSAAGGDGGNGTTATNGGGGGGGRVAIEYFSDTSSCISGWTAANVAPGGLGPNTATDGAAGSFSSSVVSPPVIALTPTFSSQASDGSGYATFTTTINNFSSNETRLKVEYSDDGGTTWYDPDLVSVTPNNGAADLDDAQTYQIGTVDGIDTDTFASVVLTIVWNTKSASNGGGAMSTRQTDIQVRVTPYDGTNLGTAVTSSSFEVDDAVPVSLASLAATGSIGQASLTWTAATDDNFNHYEIWRGTNQSDVQNRTGTAVEWDNSDDANLATATTASTTVTSLSTAGTYYFKIWAIDSYGNETTLTDINATVYGLSSWQSYQQVTIDNSAGSELTNFQVLINVVNTRNIDASCNDIRVLNFDQITPIDFWIERCDVAGSDIRIWAEIPTISASTSDNIFVYYNNTSLDVSASSASSTFLDFIDENDVASFALFDSANYSAWETIESTGGYLHFNRPNTGGRRAAAISLNSAVNAQTDFVVESRFRDDNPSTTAELRMIMHDTTSTTGYNKIFSQFFAPRDVNQDAFSYHAGTYYDFGDTTFAFGTTYQYISNVRRSASKMDYYVYDDSRVAVASATNTAYSYGSPTTANAFSVLSYPTNAKTNAYIDYVIFRKYAATEPTITTINPDPTFDSAVTADNDSDGQIDRVVMTISEDIDGGTVAGSDFTVTGYSVASASRTAASQITIVLTQSGTADTDATPSTSVVGSVTGVLGGTMTTGTQTPADAAAPMRLSQSYKDTDVNGTVDRVDLTFSEAIAYDECEAGDYSFGGADAGTIAVSACATSGDDLRLSLSNATSGDTSLALTLTYTAANGTASSLDDAAGNAVANISGVTLSDGAAPVGVSGSYTDANSDGRVDNVSVTLTESVTVALCESADYVFGGTDAGTIAVASGGCPASGSSLSFTIQNAPANDTNLNLTWAYTNAGTTGSITEGGGVVSSVSAITLSDSASPVRVSQSYKDVVSVDGKVDRVDAIFSEAITVAHCESGDYSFGGADASGLAVSSCTANGSTVEWTLSGAPTLDTNLDLTIGYTKANGVANSLRDAAGNAMNDLALVSIADAAAPRLKTNTGYKPSYVDGNADGTIDGAVLSFTEAVTISYSDGDWTTTANNLTSFDVSGVSSGNGTASVTLTASAQAGKTGVGLGTQPAIAFSALLGSIVDTSALALASFSSTSMTDAASPVGLSGSYKDTDTNGTVDRLDLTFSEGVVVVACEAGDYSIAGADAGSTVVSGCAVSGNDLRLTVTGASSNDTNLTLTTAYTAANGTSNSLTDTPGNAVANVSAISLSDAASPVRVSGSYKDIDVNGTIERLDLTFSEPIAYDECEAGDYTLAGADVGSMAISACAASGNDLRLTVTGASASDTNLTLILAYTSANGIASSLDDASNNAVGDLSAASLSDAAAPVVTAASYKAVNYETLKGHVR